MNDWKDRAIVEESSWRSRAQTVPDSPMTPDEFGAKIKAKYPDYLGVDNLELSRRVVAKYPEYASQVALNAPPSAARASHPRTARELPPGYTEAAPSRELPAGYTFVDSFLDEKPDDIDAFLDEVPRRTFRESDFADSPAARTFTDADFADAPAAQPRMAADFGDALISNLPTRGILQDIVRGLPTAGGGLVGATAAATASLPFAPLAGPFAPAVPIIAGLGGAFLGGAAGGASRQAVAQGTAAAFPEARYPILRPGQVIRNVAIEGATQAAGQAVGLGIGAAAKAARPFVNKLGAQVMRVGAGIPERAGEMAMRDPSMLLNAPTKEAASAGYKAFEAKAGITGLGDAVKQAGKFPSEGELEKHLFEVAARVQNGVPSTTQELYHASQAASSLNQLAKMGNPRYAMLKAAISEAKSAVDDTLEAILPEYKTIRTDYAMSKAAGEFSSFFPLNRNQSPNALRSVLAGREAIAGGVALAGAGTGNPVAMAALPLISPKFYGTALKGAAIAGKVPAGIFRVGANALTGGTGSALEQAYMRQRPSITPAY